MQLTAKLSFISLVLLINSGINAQAQFISSIDTLVLEETDKFFLGDPHFENVSDSLILAIDKSQSKVFIYTKTGKLKSFWGRKGSGPGDLTNPTSATILQDGNILVTEFNGRITKFSPEGDHLAILNTKITRLNGSIELPNGKVLLTGGMQSPENNYLLFIFNPSSMEIESRSFSLPFDPKEYAFQPLTLAEPSHAVVCSDKIVAVHVMLPELFFFDFEGNLIQRKKINSQLFNQMEKVTSLNNPKETVKKYGDASWILDLHCVNDGYILIQFLKDLRGEQENPVSLMLVNKIGELIKESSNMPLIKFSKIGTDTLFLPNRKKPLPNTAIKSVLIRN